MGVWEEERNKKISPAEAETGGGAAGWRRELRVRVSPSVSPNYTSHPPRKTRFRLCFYSFFHSFDHVYVTLNNMMINLQCLNILYKLNYTINGLVIGYQHFFNYVNFSVQLYNLTCVYTTKWSPPRVYLPCTAIQLTLFPHPATSFPSGKY